MRRLIILTSTLFALIMLSTSAINAQPPQQATSNTTVPEQAESKTNTDTVRGDYEFNEDSFVEPSYQNLARLYWNLGILDINDAEIVDNYLMITDCDLYHNYKKNDLEWRDIRDMARASIRRNHKSWSTSFRVTIPLYLRDYHPDEEYFDVDMALSAVNAARRIETYFYRELSTCRKSGEINGYPRNLVLFLNRPFSLPEVPVEKELARLFLDEVNTVNKKANEAAIKNKINPENLRLAYLEIFFKVHSFKEVINTRIGLQAVVFTQLDHMRVYADLNREKLLYERSMYEESKRHRRKRDRGEMTDEDLNLPDGPIFGASPKKRNE